MSTLTKLVVLLFALVVSIICVGVAYLVHRHPTWGKPLGAALSALTALAAIVTPILTRAT